MRKIKFWMLIAICVCGAALVFTSCVSNEDNAGSPTQEEEEIVEALEIADAFEPVGYEVALLCDESAFDANELAAIKYWLPKVVFNTVTNETAVVITNEITDANKANIAKVLGENYGMLLLVDPKEANVKQYAEELNMDANADYENLELIGLTGFGDQFVSYNTTEETADAVPASIASDNIWDVAPEEYLRLKAFAQWVERIEKKYADYMAYLEDLEKKIIAADAELDDESASAPRRAEAQDDSKLNIATLAGIDKTAQAFKQERFESYDNAGRSNDKDDCPLSVTCNYHFKPVYRFPEGNEPGADYYVVDASVYWDCTETLIGWKKHDHGSGRDRRSYLFFPIECKFWSTPQVTSGNYQVQVTAGGELKPGDIKPEKQVSITRDFSIDGNVSGGTSAGFDTASGPSVGGNAEGSLGVGAGYSKTEQFKVEQYEVNPYVSGATVGHIIRVPDGDNGWRPYLVSRVSGGIEVSNGVNFKKSFPVHENWIWKVTGTKPNTADSSIDVQFEAQPRVSWSSYFLPSHGLDVVERTPANPIAAKKISVPAPNRNAAGFVEIKANSTDNGKDDGKKLHIFAVKAIDTKTNKVVVDKTVSTKYGKSVKFGLPANATYSIEIEMGPRRADHKTYVFADEKGYTPEGDFKIFEMDSDIDFEPKK